MSIETVETNAWRHMDAARDAIDLERMRRLQALMPGESISFVDAPPPAPAPAPMRQAQSAGASTGEAQQQDAQAPASSPAQAAAAAQAQLNAAIGLSLLPMGFGGGASALFAATAAAAAAQAAVAAAASGTAAAPASAPPAPTASADRIALCELLLADPLLQEAVATYCPDVPTALPSNATTDALAAQYGLDLACRLMQASTAITRVFDAYCDAMDHSALQGHDAGGNGWVFIPGKPSCGDSDGTADRWEFSAEAFTADYAKGDSLAARAFASFHGDDGSFARVMREVTVISDSDDGCVKITTGGIDADSAKFKRYDTSDSTSELVWQRARMARDSLVQIDLSDPLEMFDPKAVWFDPSRGFVTASENIVPHNSWVETAVVLVIIGVATWGIGTAICAAADVAVVSAAGGAIMGATGAIFGGLFQNGTVHFEDVVRGAVTGAIMGAVSKNLDVKGIDPKTGAVTDWGTRLSAIGAKAGIQGVLAELGGDDFKDAFGAGIASGIAAEVGRSINAAIDKAILAKDLNAEQASAYRTLGRATATAIAALGNPDDPLAKFAQDFLGDTLQAEFKLPSSGSSVDKGTASADPQEDVAELDFSDIDATVGTTEGGTAGANDSESTERGSTADSGLTEREWEGIEQSDEILFNRGDELAEANGLNPIELADGRLQYADGRIVTPRVDVITHPGQADTATSSTNTTASSSSQMENGQTAGSSIYAAKYVKVEGLPGVWPVGGHENLMRAADLPMLSNEFTPNFADGRVGVGVPYRDQAGQVFYRTFDADGTYAGWVSAPALAAALPLAAAARVAAPVAEAVITAELTFGTPQMRLAAGLTLAGTAWWVANNGIDPMFREALTPDEVRALQSPTEHVPVSPGPAGTPGQIADSRDTSTPGYQAPDSQSSSTTTLPAAPAQNWQDLVTTANARNSDGSYGDIPAEHRWRYDRYLNDTDNPSPLAPNDWYRRAETAWQNTSSGNNFEAAVREFLKTPMGAGSKPVSIEGYIPDLPVGDKYGVTDIKNWMELTNSDQLRAFHQYAVDNKVPFNIIISPRTESISAPLLDNIRSTGGTVAEFDPQTNQLTIIDIGKSGPWTRGKP